MQQTCGRRACVALLVAVLAACSGKKGDSGPSGPVGPPGPSGPPGVALVPDVSSASRVEGAITDAAVSSSGELAIGFRLVGEQGVGLSGLSATSLGFVIARLEPGTAGRSNAWRAYTSRLEQPGPSGPGTTTQRQAVTERGTEGRLVDYRDGTYRYTFAKNLTTDPEIVYDARLTHRIGFEIRGLSIAVKNPVFTFQPSTGNGLGSLQREVVSNARCNACHDQLEFHGGARFDMQYCVTCHNPYSVDAQSGNSLDMAVMTHKIHFGSHLPSVEAGGQYEIYGFNNVRYDYSTVRFTQDVRNCTTCHQEGDLETPQASNWRQVANSEKCGSCHDDIDFITGNGHATGVAALDADCLICHGPTGLVAPIERSHEIPAAAAARRFRFEILDVSNTSPGERPVVTIRISDPTNDDLSYELASNETPFRAVDRAAVTVDIAWTTADFRNNDSGSASGAVSGTPAQPMRMVFVGAGALPLTRNVDGSFTATAAVPIPASGVSGSGVAALEGRAALDFDTRLPGVETLGVPGVTRTFAITDSAPVPRRTVVSLERCNDCHQKLSLHGNNRTDNTELCATCHNPNATDINRRVAGSACVAALGADDAPIDLKYMIHALHAGTRANYSVCGFGNAPHDYAAVRYPGKLDNCLGCHRDDTYYPASDLSRLATSFDAGPDRRTAADDIAVSPATTACLGCHSGSLATAHMRQNGGSFEIRKSAEGSTAVGPIETCMLCHGPGRIADVRIVHPGLQPAGP